MTAISDLNKLNASKSREQRIRIKYPFKIINIMTKQDLLDELNAAKSSHVKWHAYAQSLAMGVESGVEKLPQLYTDCDFGQWYYGAGHFLNFMMSTKILYAETQEEMQILRKRKQLHLYLLSSSINSPSLPI